MMAGGLYTDTSFWAFLLTPLCSAATTLLANIPFFIKGYKFDGYVNAVGDANAAPSKSVEIEASTAPRLVKRKCTGLGPGGS